MFRTGVAAGIFWMCMATLISSIAGGMVHKLGGDIPALQLVMVRNPVALCVLLPLVRRQGVGRPHRSQAPIYFFRVLFTYGRLTCLFYALQRMPIADVYALQYTPLLFTILLAVPILKQHVGFHGWTGVDLAGADRGPE